MVKNIIIGLSAGIVSGLFASGGGMIVVPAFISILKMKESRARATSVFAILPMVVVSGFFYLKNNYIDWKIGILCAIGGIIGGYIGTKLLKKLSDKILQISFIIFLFYVSIKMIIAWSIEQTVEDRLKKLFCM